MGSLFTDIIAGRIPGRFVWKDDLCVALLTARPIRPGHTLVVPRQEVDHWLDLPPELGTHLFETARIVGQAIQAGFRPVKVGLMIAGIEVRHVHLHLVPISEIKDLDFARQDPSPDPTAMDEAANKIRGELRRMGRTEVAL